MAFQDRRRWAEVPGRWRGPRGRGLLALACILPALMGGGWGAAAAGSPSPGEREHGADPPGLLGRLAAAGIAPEAHLLWDSSRVADGGVEERGASRWLLQVGATFDLERLAGWRGATLFAGFHAHRGRDGSLDAGDIQVYSNIDAAPFTGIDEAWLEQRLAGGRVRIKAGRIDANTEFAWIDAAGDFLNSSAGYSPTVLAMPTYPEPRAGLNVFVEVVPRVTVGAALYHSPRGRRVLTALPDERVLLGEVRVRWEAGCGGMLGVGGWHETGQIERFDGGTEDGTSGAWVVFEQRLWRVGDREDPDRALTVFAQYGSADEEVGEIHRHLAVGLLARGPAPGRPEDLAGIYVSRADLGDAPGAGFPRDETTVEAFWSFAVTRWLRLQPDVQYIRHPSGGAAGVGHALVGTLRVHLEF